MDVTVWLQWIALMYVSIGILFAIWFVFRSVDRMDDQMQGASIMMRFILFPATAALWPWLWQRWRNAKQRSS
ncbi:MAG: hypothetical protein KDC57_13035 [Saprospiraceae bacterium]|nr:hypothetical protein [Saprospiraceae bacterium]